MTAALPPSSYKHAVDSGVFLAGVDTSPLLGRLPVRCSPFGRRAKSLAFLILGQSNAGNHGQGRFTAGKRVFNFNLFDGQCYPAADPLLGSTGEEGSPWCLMADKLIAGGVADEILLAPLAVGGAAIADWAPGGPYNHRMMYALDRLNAQGTTPTHVLWHQGEADALYGTTGDVYATKFKTLAHSLRARGIAAPIYLAIAAYFGVPEGYRPQQEVVREAQRSLIDPGAGIFPGPDTDSILDRYDDCHMDETGLRKHALAWVHAIAAAP